jgi:hypothetical protein
MTEIKAVAFIDEAGQKGYVRNLDAARDDEIGLLGSLIFPVARLEEYRTAFAVPFERFKSEGGSRFEILHITEAFRPGNESLRPMAVEVREVIFDLVVRMYVPIIYCARRMRLLRKWHLLTEEQKEFAKQARRATHIKIPDRPSADRVEQDLMLGLPASVS